MKSFFFFLLQIILLLLVLQHEETCSISTNKTECPPSQCGNFTNISYPFRLKGDPASCGDPEYELTCENKRTLLLPLFPGKNYHVKAINYNNFTVRIADPGIEEGDCSSFPRYFLSSRNFSSFYRSYSAGQYRSFEDGTAVLRMIMPLFQHIIYMNCSSSSNNNNPVYVDTAPCGGGHDGVYAIVGDLKVGSFKPECNLMLVTPMSSFDYNHEEMDWVVPNRTFSYGEIHRMLVYGFELSWMDRSCQDHNCRKWDCYFRYLTQSFECAGDLVCDSRYLTQSVECASDRNDRNRNRESDRDYLFTINHYCTSPLGLPITCQGDTRPHKLATLSTVRVFLEEVILGIARGPVLLGTGGRVYIEDLSYGFLDYFETGRRTGYVLGLLASFIAMRFIFGLMIFFGKLIHIYWKRHTSVYENIEHFLQGNSLMPIRYSYKDIKKMTRGFKDMLGEGGYGTVYKGKLRSGSFVAVKMLGKAKANGQEFISEVATIGRIHHGNVVRLIGFCVDASKRALVYEFMPNSSLDKYISSKENCISLTYDQMYAISLGVAQGIAYLHQGCDMQILHFDIKPHNILLDENFIPKVSDFGLAKLYPIDNSIVPLTAARGTIGYMAPELFYQNVGGVSYKADVYSFGMLLMEMANRRRNLNPHADNSSQIFLPFWIYNQLIEEREIEIGEFTNEEKNNVRKMFIVALWCIQLRPNDHPSMTKVIEMLEGEVESIIMPPKPSLYPTE